VVGKNGEVIKFSKIRSGRAPASDFLRHSLIYAVGPSPDGPIKIGMTTNPLARISALNTDSPVEIFCYHYFWFAGTPLALRVEKACHKYLADKNLRGEWFNVTHAEAEETILKMAEETNSPWFDEEERQAKLDRLTNRVAPKLYR